MDEEEPHTDGGQSLALEERLGTGSKSWEDVQRDKWYLQHRPSFPPCTSARTTLHARDADDEDHFNVLFRIHHGRQHPAERRPNGYSEGWDGQKVRQEDVADFCREEDLYGIKSS